MHFSAFFTHCPACGSSDFVHNNEKSKRCNACQFIYYMNASAAVANFILNDANELLVCVRGKEPQKGTLDLPGGFVDDNETAEEAVTREIAEELNAKVIDAKYLFSLPNTYEYSGLNIPTLDLFYACKLESTTQLTASDDVAECYFLPLNEIKPELFGLSSISKGVSKYLAAHATKK